MISTALGFAGGGTLLVLGVFMNLNRNLDDGLKQTKRKPHIIVIITDDMGYNDVGFHGSNQIPTPNIDALAYNGIILDRFYAQCTCTPSRTAFMTGNYPIRSGMQGAPLKAGENRGLPADMPTTPEQLKKLGYKTHLVGKWHLGAAYRNDTPTERGFDTHLGYWNGFVGYFDYVVYTTLSNQTKIKGFDLHDQLQPLWSAQDKYATDLFTERALEIIDRHNAEEPLYLVMCHLAPHTGKDGYELGVLNTTLTHLKFSYIKDPKRRLYADVVNKMDNSVGRIIEKLSEKKLLKDSIVLFFADNGAPTVGKYDNSGSNWPLRGIKHTDYEGGVRTAAAIYSPLFKKRSYVSKQIIHLTDWLPTFYAAAGGDLKNLNKIDGVNQWETLSENKPTKRSEILININEVDNTRAIIGENGRYKLLDGTYKHKNFYGDDGRGSSVPRFKPKQILETNTNKILGEFFKISLRSNQILQLRKQADLSWCRNFTNEEEETPINCTQGCLFDLENDPCETTNIIESEPEIAQKLYSRMRFFEKELVPQKNQPYDPKADPIQYNNTWCTWLDDEICFKTPNNKQRITR